MTDATDKTETPITDDYAERVGRHVISLAEKLGWKQGANGEGCTEFIMRKTREVATADAAESALQSAWGEAREAAEGVLRMRAAYTSMHIVRDHLLAAADEIRALPAPSKAAPLTAPRSDADYEATVRAKPHLYAGGAAPTLPEKEGEHNPRSLPHVFVQFQHQSAFKDECRVCGGYSHDAIHTPAVQLRADGVVINTTR